MAREMVALKTLDPRWLVDMPAHRWGVGLDLVCPNHGDHRIRMLFANPVDGGLPLQDEGQLFWRMGETFAELSLLAQHDHSESMLEVRGHWTGRILTGQLQTERLDSDDVTRRTPTPTQP